MKLYLKDGNVLKVNDNAFLVLLNLDEFVSSIKEGANNPGQNNYLLRYILTANNEDYLGSSQWNSSSGFTNNIEKSSPYKVKLLTWHIATFEDSYLEFEINS